MLNLRYIPIAILGYAQLVAGARPADRARPAAVARVEKATVNATVNAPAATAAPSEDVRDVLLMLDEGPLHLRFRVTLSGVSLAAARDAYVDRLMQKLDTDGDGKLSPEEAARSPLRTPRRGASEAAFLNKIDGNRVETRKDIVQAVERFGGQMVSYRHDVTASKNDLEVFKLLDADGSGFLDRAEMAASSAKILERDQDQDECISFQEFLPIPEPDPQAVLAPQHPAAPARPVSVRDSLLRDINESMLSDRLVKKYDRDRDKKLSPDELGWPAERVKMLDANSDGKLSVKELAGIGQTPVDLELAVDLDGPPDGKPALEILSTLGKRVDDATRPDVVRLVFAKAVLTFSFRKIDPVKTAIDKAMRVFNMINVDGNGYLDAKETAMLIRFERELFDMLDADGDGKIFGEEMEKYVTARGEPETTTARISVYDTGRGFFEALDANGDGRISMREIKSAAKSLQSMTRRNSDKLSPKDPIRNFHIEFMRGSFSLFRDGDQATAQTPAFELRAPIGPIWFQRMDRNNDGDLTWNEFLGPREVFHRIDTDGDGLIDPLEAAAADEE